VYGDKVRIAWKHFPLDFHAKAPLAHLASQAAAEQGKFWDFHDKIFGDQKNLEKDAYLRYAKELGLDVKKFEDALNTSRGKAVIDADKAEAQSLGVTGTPAFFVNGKFLSGAKPFAEFANVINAELTRLKIPIPAEAQQAAGGAPAPGAPAQRGAPAAGG
jgi:protein-disulfide isomerase